MHRHHRSGRRKFLMKAGVVALPAILNQPAISLKNTMRIGLTPVMLDDQYAFLQIWQRWLERQLATPVEFVQRQRYSDITKLLLDRSIDAAWVCGYPYVRHQQQMRMLAIPEYQGAPLYQSLIISGNTAPGDSENQGATLQDFSGKVMAYSDPDSNSGYLYPIYQLRKTLSKQPDFFRRAFFTWGHRNTIEAVAAGLADVGAVDSYIWESLVRIAPEYQNRIRVIQVSPKFGFPPLVTHIDFENARFELLANTLQQMHLDDEGKGILGKLFLDRFAPADATTYTSIADMMHETERLKLITAS